MYIIFTKNKKLVESARLEGAQIVQLSGENVVSQPTPHQETVPQKVIKDNKPEAVISKLFKDIGISPHTKGYQYIKYLMVRSLEDPDFMDSSMTKTIYPACAAQFYTTTSRAERAIRHANQSTYDKHYSSPEYIEVFGRLNGYPCNAFFLRSLAIYIRENLM